MAKVSTKRSTLSRVSNRTVKLKSVKENLENALEDLKSIIGDGRSMLFELDRSLEVYEQAYEKLRGEYKSYTSIYNPDKMANADKVREVIAYSDNIRGQSSILGFDPTDIPVYNESLEVLEAYNQWGS